jgi:hypothetical protein
VGGPVSFALGVMVDLIRWLRSRPTTSTDAPGGRGAAAGFVYVAHGETGPMASASVGTRVGSFSDRPPWIVVDQTPQAAILAKWPGRLWRVRILRKAPEQPLAYAAYTRATAVHVEEELPLAALFDHNGQEVVDFLSSISSLSAEQRALLGSSIDERAVSMLNQVWNRWLSQVDSSSPYLGQDHSNTIAVGAQAPRSPVGNAPSVLHTELTNRARELDGDSAFVTDDEGQSFNAEWSRVASHLQHALFAFGVSPELLSPPERVALASAYRKAAPSSWRRDDA